ncbi:hypothetical protein KEJ47_06425 [Candidatus Bathyarchaeota archaeon]|nr:hypothetical protein [Candidatus Bathyarchaeota archaeon]
MLDRDTSLRGLIIGLIKRATSNKTFNIIAIMVSLLIIVLYVPIIPYDIYEWHPVLEKQTQTIDSASGFILNPGYYRSFGDVKVEGGNGNVTFEIRSSATVRVYVLTFSEFWGLLEIKRISHYQAKSDLLNDTVEFTGLQKARYFFIASIPSLDGGYLKPSPDGNVTSETIRIYSTRIVAQWNQETLEGIYIKKLITIQEYLWREFIYGPKII